MLSAGCSACLDCLQRGRAPVVPDLTSQERTGHRLGGLDLSGSTQRCRLGALGWAFNPRMGIGHYVSALRPATAP